MPQSNDDEARLFAALHLHRAATSPQQTRAAITALVHLAQTAGSRVIVSRARAAIAKSGINPDIFSIVQADTTDEARLMLALQGADDPDHAGIVCS
jgi:hypothetical protein